MREESEFGERRLLEFRSKSIEIWNHDLKICAILELIMYVRISKYVPFKDRHAHYVRRSER